MKTASQELRELIHSLSHNEQNQFIREGKVLPKPAYIQLFEYYARHSKLSDAEIKRASGIKNFERVKHYLHKQVLDFVARHSNVGSQKEIMNMLLAADALSERLLFTQALQIMIRAKKIAEKKQLYIFKLLIDSRIHEIQSSLGSTGHFDYFTTEYDQKEFPADIKKIEEEQRAKAYLLRRRMFALKNNSLMRSNSAIAELKETFGTYLRQIPAEIESFTARNEFYIVAAYYHQQLGKNAAATKFFETSAKEYETINPNPSDNYIGYTTTLHNLMFTYSKSHHFEKIRPVLDKLIALKPRNKNHRNFIMQSYVNYESLYCKHHPEFPSRRQKLKFVERYVKENRASLANLHLLQTLFNLSVNYFIEKNFRKALEIINECDVLESQGILKDHISVVKTYKLVIYYEMEKLDLLSFAIKNTYRFMLINMQYFAFEKEVITALRKIINIPGTRQQNKIWEETHTRLLALKKNTDAVQVFNLFNFTGWLHCRLKGLPYDNIMNER